MLEQIAMELSTLGSTRVGLSICSRLKESKITFRDIQSLGSSHKGNCIEVVKIWADLDQPFKRY